MIATEQQRRWWFANHPEYSHHETGKRTGHNDDSAQREAQGAEKLDPKDVIAYADESLTHVTNPVVIAILESLRRHAKEMMQGAGSQARGDAQKAHLGFVENSPNQDLLETFSDGEPRVWGPDQSAFPGSEDALNDFFEEERRQAIERDKMGIEPDPHWALDLMPYRRFLTAPIEALKALLKSFAENAAVSAAKKGGKGWKVGDDPLAPTSKGNVPTWTTQAERQWKNEAAKPGALEEWGERNIERMNRGRAPQRRNRDSGEWESMELHHTPTPRRDKGTEVINLWPDEHAELDPYRRLKKK